MVITEHTSVVNASTSTLLGALIRRIFLGSVFSKLLFPALLFWLYTKYKAYNSRQSNSLRNSLAGRTVLLTGAGGALGRAQALELARNGCKLILLDIDGEQLKNTAEITKERVPSAQVHAYVINIINREALYNLAMQIQRDHGFVWGLINNAGVLIGKPFLETPDEKIELTMDVNIMAHFWLVKAFLPPMLERDEGHIVGVASAAAYFPSARMVEYCASKFAVRGFMEALRKEICSLGKYGVNTTLVAPANINQNLFSGMGSPMKAEYVASQIVNTMQCGCSHLFLPWHLVFRNAWQNMVPTSISDFFAHTMHAGLKDWEPNQANRVMEKILRRE